MQNRTSVFDDDLDAVLGLKHLGDEEEGLVDDAYFSKRKDTELVQFGGPYQTKRQFLQVTVRLPETNPVAIVAMLYGFLLYVIPILMGIGYAVSRSFLLLYGLFILIATVALNEGVLKPRWRDPRPPQTANLNPDGTPRTGMPSGHSANAYALLTWSSWEVIHSRHHLKVALWIPLLCILLGPMPWARWYNRDHTVRQSVVGCIVGCILGALFAAQRSLFFSITL